MSRNLHCGCLCHGTNGNRIGDEYFSCKGCYAASHMNNLPRKVVQQRAKPAGPRKPRVAKPAVQGLAAVIIKTATKVVMENIATAAEELKNA